MSDPKGTLESVENGSQATEVALRDPKTGRWAKGNDAHSRLHIERKKEKAAPILAAITEELSPDEIRVLLRRGIAMAQEAEDGGKMVLEYIRFVASYTIGKPVQRAITAQVTRDDFLSLFRPQRETEEEEGEDYVEGG